VTGTVRIRPSPAAALLVLCAALCAVPAAARGEDRPALLLPAALGRADLVWISGRVLAEEQGRHGPKAVRTARQLSASNLEGASVTVTFLGRTAHAVSGHDGEFEVAIRADPGAPFPPGPSPFEVRAAGARAAGVVHVLPSSATRLVVSDFDDTVAVTNVTSTRGLLRATFLEDGDTQPAVPGMAALLRCLVEAEGGPGAVAFVSGSPVQLAPRIARFLDRNGFPPAALFLRNLGPRSLSGYKEPVLRALLARFPGLGVVLVGDSGERDPEIYRALAREFPDRVLRVYVRKATAAASPPERFDGELLFDGAAEAARDAAARGLGAPACFSAAFPPLAPAGDPVPATTR
jgi:phosphatidate phosphatase APP1